MGWLAFLGSILDSGLTYGLIQAFLALSVVITLLALNFPDLSIEGTFPLGAAIGAVLLFDARLNPVIVIVVGFVAGSLAGVVTGLLHVRLRMSKLLSGICVATMLYTVSLLVMSGRPNIPLLGTNTLLAPFEQIDAWFNSEVFHLNPYYFHPGTIFALLGLLLMTKIAIDRLLLSEFGVVLRATGINEPALPFYKRNPAFYKVAGLALGNGLASLAGTVSAQHQGFADVNMGVGILVSSLVAVILGQELFSRLRLNLGPPTRMATAAVVGSLVYSTMIATILSAGTPPTTLRFFSGFALILIIFLRSRHSEVSFSW